MHVETPARAHLSSARSWHVRYYLTEIVAGVPVRKQRSHKLCTKDDRHHSAACKPVRQLCESFMRGVNDRVPGQSGERQDMPVVAFWERYLLYCEEIIPLTGKSRKKPSTVRGYRQIWRQHLALHFGKVTLQEYEPSMGTAGLPQLEFPGFVVIIALLHQQRFTISSDCELFRCVFPRVLKAKYTPVACQKPTDEWHGDHVVVRDTELCGNV